MKRNPQHHPPPHTSDYSGQRQQIQLWPLRKKRFNALLTLVNSSLTIMDKQVRSQAPLQNERADSGSRREDLVGLQVKAHAVQFGDDVFFGALRFICAKSHRNTSFP